MAFVNPYPHVFSPLKVGNQTLKNRIEFSPLVSNMVTKEGEITQDYINFVEMQAKSGAALITIGATPVNRGLAREYHSEVNVCDDAMLNGLHRLTETAHIFGAKLSVELFHSGLGGDPALSGEKYVLGPSNFPIPNQAQYVNGCTLYFTTGGDCYTGTFSGLDTSKRYKITLSYDSSKYYITGAMKVQGIANGEMLSDDGNDAAVA